MPAIAQLGSLPIGGRCRIATSPTVDENRLRNLHRPCGRSEPAIWIEPAPHACHARFECTLQSAESTWRNVPDIQPLLFTSAEIKGGFSKNAHLKSKFESNHTRVLHNTSQILHLGITFQPLEIASDIAVPQPPETFRNKKGAPRRGRLQRTWMMGCEQPFDGDDASLADHHDRYGCRRLSDLGIVFFGVERMEGCHAIVRTRR